MLARTFTVAEGLLPEKPGLTRWLGRFTLEAGVTLGGLLVVLGLAGSCWAVFSWGATAFGHLDPTRMLRLVIPSATFIMLGSEVIFGSLFLSVLNLRIRPLVSAVASASMSELEPASVPARAPESVPGISTTTQK